MEEEVVARAIAATSSLAAALDLPVDDAVVLHSSNKLGLHLVPCDVFARVALAGQEALALEVRLAQQLAAWSGPVATLEPRVEPRAYAADGFVTTFWTYYEKATSDRLPPAEYADALHRLHAGMRRTDIVAPHATERVEEAVSLVANRDETPALPEDGRQLLLRTLHGARDVIWAYGAPEQLLHGEPHPGNVLSTRDGPVFIDFETCCRGPVELDVAHAPDDVSAYYPGLDPGLVQECRRLVLAMVAAWRWDARDEFPDGRRHGQEILALLRDGPPWPALGPLTDERPA